MSKFLPSSRPNRVMVYCDGPDLKYAEAFLSHYDRVLHVEHDGQWLTIQFDIEDLPSADAALTLEILKEDLSKCIRRHRKPSTPPPSFPSKS